MHVYLAISVWNVRAVEVLPRIGYVGPERDQMYSRTLPSTSALDGVDGQRHATAALLTPFSRVLEKLTGFAANQGIPRKFITVLTSTGHLSLSLANSIHFQQPLHTSEDPS